MILGLDCSTSCCGWSICSDSTVKSAGFIKLDKHKTNKEKCLAVISFLDSLDLIKQVNQINLEASLSGFGGGFTTQQTIITLSRFNAVLEYILGEHYKIPVNLINVSTARKFVLGKARIANVKPKDYVKMVLPTVVPNLQSFEKLNKLGKWDAHNSDTFDAIVMGLYTLK